MDWVTVVPAIAAVLALLWGAYQFGVNRSDKRDDDRHASHEQRFDEHAKAFIRHQEWIQDNEREIRLTRDELHRDYLRSDDMDRREEKLVSAINALHQRLSGIARDLNQAIGEANARSRQDMLSLVTQVTQAIKGREDDKS